MKLCLTSILALFMIGHSIVSADDSSSENPNAEGTQRAQRFRPGERQNGERTPGQRRPGQFAGGFSPEQMVQRLMEEFDADGDEKLNVDELQKMMMTMRAGGEKPKRPPAAE